MLDWQICGLGALQYPVDEVAGAAKQRGQVCSIADQATGIGEFTTTDRGDAVLYREFRDLFFVGGKRGMLRHHDRTDALLGHCCESAV